MLTRIAPAAIIHMMQSILRDDQIMIDPAIVSRIDGEEHAVVVVEPEDEQEVANVLATAKANQLSISIVGSGTQLNLGNVSKPIDLVIRTLRMNQILEYSPADMTVTVQAGVRFADLQAHLAKHGQMLAIDPSCAKMATLGGIVATNGSGPMRVLHGSLRDHTIGMRVVYPSGEIIRTGGKVVKNVAGYDMTKLFIGSLGTLGFLSEITFKLKPLPLHRELCILSGDLQQLQEISLRLTHSHLIPSTFEVLSSSFLHTPGSPSIWGVAVGCEEVQSASAYQTGVLREWAKELGMTFAVRIGTEVVAFWEEYHEQIRTAPLQIKISTKATTLFDDAEAIQAFADLLKLPIAICMNRAQGTALVFSQGGTVEQWEQLVQECRHIAKRQNGFAILAEGPLQLRKRVDAFGPAGPTFALMRGIKDTIDPTGILNPGRFWGGI